MAALRSEQLEEPGYTWCRMQENLAADPKEARSSPQTASTLPVLGWITSQSLEKKDWKHHVIAGSLAMGILIWKGPTKRNFSLLLVSCTADSTQSCNCRVPRDKKAHKALHWYAAMFCFKIRRNFLGKSAQKFKKIKCALKYWEERKKQPDCRRSAMLIRERNALLTLQTTNR